MFGRGDPGVTRRISHGERPPQLRAHRFRQRDRSPLSDDIGWSFRQGKHRRGRRSQRSDHAVRFVIEHTLRDVGARHEVQGLRVLLRHGPLRPRKIFARDRRYARRTFARTFELHQQTFVVFVLTRENPMHGRIVWESRTSERRVDTTMTNPPFQHMPCALEPAITRENEITSEIPRGARG
jgi:hypothetical protein